MEDFFPDAIPWLDNDPKFRSGVEIGAVLMLLRLGAPLIKVKVSALNEDQLRAAAGSMKYHTCVDLRDDGWSHLTFATKGTTDTLDDENDS